MDTRTPDVRTEDRTNSSERSHLHDRDPKDIQGWGADLDPGNRPAYPKERMPQRLEVPWAKPEQQPMEEEVLLSIEYPAMRPLHGATLPPSGLSGIMRRAAFKRSENDIRHWLMLIAADRVNVFEGIFEDFAQGRIPNIFAEMGWKAKFKYNRKGAIAKSLVIAGVLGYVGYRIFRPRYDDGE